MLCFYVALSLALFVLDMRFHALELLRQGVSIVADPLQHAAQAPLRLASEGLLYLKSLDDAEEEIERLKAERLAIAPEYNRLQQLQTENSELRLLLALNQRKEISGHLANVLRSARDPFVRRVYLDKGMQDGIIAGQPVIDDKGVVGQITRVFPFSSELTLITDKNLAVPVQVQRTGQRSVAFGLGNGQMELRYMPTSADVVVGDLLYTSGLDQVYPSGFQVARVTELAMDSANAFARIIAEPISSVETRNIVMILNPLESLPSLPEEEAEKPAARKGKRR